MAWGKEKFRDMYRTSNESLNTIKNNYHALDHDYQMLGKALLEIKEYINNMKVYDIKETDDIDNINKIIDKALDLKSQVKIYVF